VRFRTAAILSVVLIGGMFAFPTVVFGAFPSLGEGSPNSVPGYERILLGFVVFCGLFRWFLSFPIVVVLFAIAAFTNAKTSVRR
jgi:hypothetical protein